MNLPRFLKLIDDTVSKMTKEELAERIHEMARVLPEEDRDWFLSMIIGELNETVESEGTLSGDLYELLDKIISGEYRLDSELNEAWDDWYGADEPPYLFEDSNELLPVIEAACAELHRLVDNAEYDAACRLGQILLTINVRVDGDYADCEDDSLNIYDLELNELVSFSVDDMLLEISCAVYFTYSGQERSAALYRVGSSFHHGAAWTLEQLLQHAPTELTDFDAFLTDWILYLQTIEEKVANVFLNEALEMRSDPASALDTARQSVRLHPEIYLTAFSMQKDDRTKLEIGLEALDSIDPGYTVRSEIALQSADIALKAGNTEYAVYCRTEAFRSDCTALNFLRALVNHPDYSGCLEELHTIVSDYREQYSESIHEKNMLDENTLRLIRFLSGEFQTAYADSFGKYSRYTNESQLQGIALIALFLYPDGALREGGMEMLRTLEAGLPFRKDEYMRGLDISERTDNDNILWDCFKKCRSHTPLPDRENAFNIIQKHCAEYTDFVMKMNMRDEYEKCAAYAAVIGEILESECKILSKNEYLLTWKQRYFRRTAYHRELRKYGMNDGKR